MLRQLTKVTKRIPKQFVTWKSDLTAEEAMQWETQYCTNNYEPLEVVIAKGEGVKVWDIDGNEYYDFLSAYSAVSQGHNHPKIIDAMKEQADDLAVISRAFFNDKLGQYAKRICDLFGYDKFVPMNSGAEAVESGLKIARKWGYEKKGIPEGEALIVSVNGNFHGRTFGAIALSEADNMKDGFYPMLPGIVRIDYNDLSAVKECFERLGDNICAIIMEPIQGEAGIFVPDDGYLKGVEELCHEYNILFICDEIQTGLGRTGKLLASYYDDVKPDILLLGKALSGGSYPVSCAIGKLECMEVLTVGTHGSTFGGNPIACACAMAALDVIEEEGLSENAYELGIIFRDAMNELVHDGGIITDVRGKGLLNAVEFDHDHPKMVEKGLTAKGICKILKTRGLLAKQTHGNIIRFAPPLVMTETEIGECIDIISEVIREVEA